MGRLTYDFDGETVIVTGGSSGIGRAVATRFGEAGAVVLIADLREEPKDQDAVTPTHELIEERGGQADYLEVDVTDATEIEAAVEHAADYGGVDVMINNAGYVHSAPLLEYPVEELERIMAVNVRGVFLGTKIAANDMRDRDVEGCILNTASISSTIAQHDQVAYDASKGAVRMITRGAALELAPEIRVNAVAPGQIATEFASGWTDAAERGAANDELLKPVPMRRAGHPGDLAGAYCFLASEDADYVTGEVFHVDGGWQIC